MNFYAKYYKKLSTKLFFCNFNFGYSFINRFYNTNSKRSMKRNSWVLLILFFITNIQLTVIQAQNFIKDIQFEWQSPLVYKQADAEKIEFLSFIGSVSDESVPVLPRYYTHFPVDADYSDYEISITAEHYEPVPADEIRLIPKDFAPNEIRLQVETVYEKKKPHAAISFVPIRKGANGYERLTSVTLSLKGLNARKGQKGITEYATHSVLQSGNWYRITVSSTGIYKVTYNDLVSLGIAVSGLPSSQIAIFGNGGGMLPESNAGFRYDDLQELPIEMHDGGDNHFDAGDYFIFYAEGPHRWDYNSAEQKFTHQFNLYAKTASYFINVDAGVGAKLRIADEDNSNLIANATAATYTHYGFYETDQFNLGEGGRAWFGDKFDAITTRSYTMGLPASIVGPVRLTARLGSTSVRYATFTVSANGQNVGTVGIAAVNDGDLANTAKKDLNFNTSGGNVTLDLTYSKPTSSSVGYLDYIECQAECNLRAGSGQTSFCNLQTIGNNNVTQFSVSNVNNGMKVWDVTKITNTKQMAGSLSGQVFTFKAATDSLRKFVIFSENSCLSITPVGKIGNQDLHGSSMVDMVILAHPDFLSQAERLANFRRSINGGSLTVKVVTPQQVYNEFSSGEQDICAIRDYMRMIYDKTNGTQPQYLLLFGRPSYDYRGIEGTCTLYIPNYQANTEINTEYFKAYDDFFGFLDVPQGSNGTDRTLDVAIGRLPVSTAAQAQIAVDKIIKYSQRTITGENTQSCNYGDWKNIATFVADDENYNCHINTADAAAQRAASENPNLNIEKIYLDAYQQVTYSSSARYPEVTTAINNRMNKGCLLFTYVGHGGKNGWANERIIELTDINKWKNKNNQPWMFTMTCEFGWCDRSLVSPAELCFLNANGGVTGMVTTMRVAYTGGNDTYIRNLYANLFTRPSWDGMPLGEANRLAKNAGNGNISDFNMIYVLGDPAMKLNHPYFSIVTDSINGIPVENFSDTLKALSRVTISGHIDDLGTVFSTFNGTVFPSIYDKKVINNTLQNDPGSQYFEFEVQKNILFKGNVSVKNGLFHYTFILPKDINYAYGNGKISHYGYNSVADAAGSYSNIVIGGMSDETITDANGPEIELYMNDEKFVNGGTVNTSPTLLVKLKDEYGINTTGNGIGHDLVAILDDKDQIILNNYYEAERDSFNCGTVRYPYEGLSLGTHKLKVRAWDILNNVTEKELEFVVTSDEGFTLDHVLNYPNPFTTHTSFYFEHNRPGEQLDILITVYTISGKVVKILESTQYNEGFRSDAIEWDGLDNYGDKIGKGTYLYRLRVRTANGEQAEKVEKIVIL